MLTFIVLDAVFSFFGAAVSFMMACIVVMAAAETGARSFRVVSQAFLLVLFLGFAAAACLARVVVLADAVGWL